MGVDDWSTRCLLQYTNFLHPCKTPLSISSVVVAPQSFLDENPTKEGCRGWGGGGGGESFHIVNKTGTAVNL